MYCVSCQHNYVYIFMTGYSFVPRVLNVLVVSSDHVSRFCIVDYTCSHAFIYVSVYRVTKIICIRCFPDMPISPRGYFLQPNGPRDDCFIRSVHAPIFFSRLVHASIFYKRSLHASIFCKRSLHASIFWHQSLHASTSLWVFSVRKKENYWKLVYSEKN